MFIGFVIGTIGFFVGLFGFSNIVLPLFYSLPRARNMVKREELKKNIIPKFFTAPIICMIIIIGLYLLTNYFNRGKEFLSGLVIGIVLHMLGLLRPETRKDMNKEFLEFIERFKIKQ